MTTTTTLDPSQTIPEHDGLQDLLDVSTGWEKYELDNAGQVWSLDRNGARKAIVHTNIAEHLDSIVSKNASKVGSILDMSEDISSRPAITPPWNFTSMAAFWTHFLTGGTTNAKDAIDLYFSPGASTHAVRASANPLKYEYQRTAGSPWVSIDILELMEWLYSARKISIDNIDDSANKIARKKEQAERRAERDQERAERQSQGAPNAISSPTNSAESWEAVDYIGQINRALAGAKKNRNHTGEYIFYGEKEPERMPVRYDTTTLSYHALYRKSDGKTAWIVDTNPDVVAQKLDKQRMDAEKSKKIKEFAETVDMGTEFDRVQFTKLCEAIWKSKWHRGEYTLNGKTYFIHERSSTTGGTFTPFSPKQFTVNYPGPGGTKTTEEHLHISNKRAAEDPTVENLIDFLEGHHGIYNSHHDKNRSVLLESIKTFANDSEKVGHYVYKWNQYEMRKKRSIIWKVWLGYKYWANVPAWEHSTKEIGPFLSKENFYKAIKEELDNFEHWPKHEDKHEKGEKHEKEEGKAHDKWGHSEAEHGSSEWSVWSALKTLALAPVKLFNKQPAWVRGAEVGLGYALYSGGAVLLWPAVVAGAAVGAGWWGLKKLWRIKNPAKWNEESHGHH